MLANHEEGMQQCKPATTQPSHSTDPHHPAQDKCPLHVVRLAFASKPIQMNSRHILCQAFPSSEDQPIITDDVFVLV